MSNKYIRALTNPRYALSVAWRRLSPFITSDTLYLKVLYRLVMREKLNLENPKSYYEKIQWLKLHNTKEIFTQMVDKFNVREIIKEKLGEDYLIPLLGVWDNFDEIDFDILPNEFVLKATHDSGSVIVCKDKSKFDKIKARKFLNGKLKKNFFYYDREMPYKNVTPRLIAEKYMVDESGTDLKDYKLFCFNGKVELIQVDCNRFTKHTQYFFDAQWNLLDLQQSIYPRDPSVTITQPICLDKMISITEKLSESIPHIRVDFYVVHHRIYFSEFTFHHQGGLVSFHPPEWGTRLGNLIILP